MSQLFASGGQSIESISIKWPKYFSFNIIPSTEHPGLISFRMEWLDLLAVQGTLNNLLQHHSSKASILWLSAFFIVQLSHPYTTTGKTIVLTRRTFVGKADCCPPSCKLESSSLSLPAELPSYARPILLLLLPSSLPLL